eukprot:scpid36209/ scgid14591/ 
MWRKSAQQKWNQLALERRMWQMNLEQERLRPASQTLWKQMKPLLSKPRAKKMNLYHHYQAVCSLQRCSLQLHPATLPSNPGNLVYGLVLASSVSSPEITDS